MFYNKNRDDIDLSLKQIDPEESLYKTIEAFQSDHLISISDKDIVEIFKQFRDCNDDYEYVLQCAKDKVNIFVYLYIIFIYLIIIELIMKMNVIR